MKCLKCQLTIPDPSPSHYGLHPQCFMEWFHVNSLVEFTHLQKKTHNDSDFSSQDSSFFQGTFKKYSAQLNNNLYILKMRQDETPELPEVEYLCNQIGSLLGIPVADFYFIDFYGDKVFVTRNFIHNDTPTDLQHIYHFRLNNPHSCEELIRIVHQQSQHPHDVNTLIKTILFDSLIGNHDRHGRNLAFITTAKNVLLSPIYDNVSYLGLEKGDMLKANFNPTGKIITSETNEPTMRDYVKELKKLGHNNQIQLFYDCINLPKLHQVISQSFCSTLMKTAIKSLINKRFEELKHALASFT